jgi:hypothetical protein
MDIINLHNKQKLIGLIISKDFKIVEEVNKVGGSGPLHERRIKIVCIDLDEEMFVLNFIREKMDRQLNVLDLITPIDKNGKKELSLKNLKPINFSEFFTLDYVI